MPNRMLYTGLLTSKKINSLSPDAFELYIRLMLIVDDYGRYSGSPTRIARSCWPDKEEKTGPKITSILQLIITSGLLIEYEVDGERYIQITKWKQRARAAESKFPPILDQCQTDDGQVTGNSQADDGSRVYDVDVDVDVDDISAEQASCFTQKQKPLFELPLITGKLYPVYQSNVDNWNELYPAADVPQEIRKMIGWLEGNPKNKKTAGGIVRFITSWLSKAQDRARAYSTAETEHKTTHTGGSSYKL